MNERVVALSFHFSSFTADAFLMLTWFYVICNHYDWFVGWRWNYLSPFTFHLFGSLYLFVYSFCCISFLVNGAEGTWAVFFLCLFLPSFRFICLSVCLCFRFLFSLLFSLSLSLCGGNIWLRVLSSIVSFERVKLKRALINSCEMNGFLMKVGGGLWIRMRLPWRPQLVRSGRY